MPRLTILMYHRVAPVPRDTNHPKNFVTAARLKEQVDGLLSWGYEPVTFAEWLAYRAHRTHMPPRPFIVTFDDGYVDFADAAWPVLRDLGVPATVFLVASLIGGTNEWDPNEPTAQLLDADAIAALERDGVSFGGHGYAHLPLANISPNEARDDIARCRASLAEILAKPPDLFAYPFSNQSATVRRLTRTAGFHCAVRGKGRLNARWTDPFGLHRILMHDGISAAMLKRMLMRLRWLTLP